MCFSEHQSIGLAVEVNLTLTNINTVFTYKFIIAPNGYLALQLLGNYKKSQMSLKIRVKDDTLALANARKKRGEPSEVTSLRNALRSYETFLENVQRRIPEGGQRSIDVKNIRAEFEEYFGFVPRKSKKEEPGAFVTHFQKFIDSKTNKGTRGVYKHTLDKIRAFDSRIDTKNFEDITLQWLTEFEAFCARTATKNARNIHLRNIRAVFNNAIDFEITTAYPFRRFKIRPEATKKRAMSVEELRKFFRIQVEPYAEIYKDMFCLIFMLIGINSADLWALKSITRDGRIEYKRAKTGRLYSIKVEPEALEIINKYRGKNGLLCIADRWSDSRNFRHQCNKALQRIGQVERKGRGGKKIIEAEWPELTTYWARHSWATIAYNDLQIPKDIIAQALGHSGSETVTDIYLNKDPKLVDEANRRVLDWVLYGKR